jgi:uncharacterized protein (TIGR02145 family)
MKKGKILINIFVVFFLTSYLNAQTVTIGTQVWMTKNLNVDKFRNGDSIPQAKTDEEWKKAGENGQPAWCYYDNNPANGAKYGKLYNFYAVNDSRGLAPKGYHIPTDAEWTTLIDYLGSDAGKKMKSKSAWKSYDVSKTCPNCDDWSAEYRKKAPCHTCKDTRSVPETRNGNGTNASGFSGLPGGYRNYYGSFHDIGKFGYWSRSEVILLIGVQIPRLGYDDGNVLRSNLHSEYGLSVRCLKD